MRFPLCALLALGGLLVGCDAEDPFETQQEFEQNAPPLELAIETVGPANPVRDTLRVRVTGTNTTDTLRVQRAHIDGERVSIVKTRVDARTVDIATYVSERDGPLDLAVEASDTYFEVIRGDTLFLSRAASTSIQPVVEQTITRRLVVGPDAFRSDVSDVFHDARGHLWVRIAGYRSSFWSSPDGASFTRRRSGFEDFMAYEGDTAWIEATYPDQFNAIYLERVDLSTGESVAEHRVYYDDSLYGGLYAGAAHDGAFYGIDGNRRNVMHIGEEYVEAVPDPPYRLQASGYTLLDYHISPDATHWLATAGRGVLRNAGAGWESTAGLASEDAIALAAGPEGSVWTLAVDGDRCVVQMWTGQAWDERVVLGRDGNRDCGVFAVGETGGVWRGTTDGEIVRYKGGRVDRRYQTYGVTSMLAFGRTLWVGTGYGLREILDHENEEG
jgi:hypothetical protein